MQEVLIEYKGGGPRDGLNEAIDDPFKVSLLLWGVRSVEVTARIKENPTPKNFLTIQIPSSRSKIAKEEQWSEAKKRALLYHDIYHVISIQEIEGLSILTAQYQGHDY